MRSVAIRFSLTYLTGLFALFIIYFITAKAGLTLNAVSGFATLVWPPTGISLAIVFLFGYRFWPAIFVAAFLVNLIIGAPPLVSLGIASGNTLEALIGALSLKKFKFNPAIDRLPDALKIILLGALLSTLFSSTIGTLSLLWGGIITFSAFNSTWLAWWIGDALADLVVAPLIFVWLSQRANKYFFNPAKVVEFIVAFLMLIILSGIAFSGFLGLNTKSVPVGYIVVPAMIWIAVRFTQLGSTMAVFLLSVIAIGGTVIGDGVFARDNLSESLLLLQGFIGVHAGTFLILSAVVEESKSLARKKDEFIGMASHELKTPMTTIKAYSQLLIRSFAKNRKASLYLGKMNSELDKLIKLVNDLLDFNRIGLGKLEIQKNAFFIDDLINEIVEQMRITNKQREIIFRSSGKIQVEADIYRVGQVISNLLLNAMKFSSETKAIYVTASKKAGEFVIVDVKDSGIGIAEKYQKQVFNRFFQAKEKSSDFYSGLGLGLYISSEIIRFHGGKIWVKSKEGRGSTFSFSLPLKSKG